MRSAQAKAMLSFYIFAVLAVFAGGIVRADDGFYVIAVGQRAKRTILVSPQNTPQASGNALLNAVNGIVDASEANSYLVIIEPGVYHLGGNSLQMKPFLDIQGSGENATRIVGTIDSRTSGVLRGSDDSELRFITVENEGGGPYAIAIYNDGSSPKITNVTAIVSGASTHYAVFNLLGSPSITNTTIIARGGQYNYGLFDDTSSSNVTHLTVSASAGTGNNVAVRLIRSDSTITDSQISVTGGGSSENIGVDIYQKTPSLTNCSISVLSSGGGTHFGVQNTYGNGARIEHCRIDSVGYGIFCDSISGVPDTTTVLHSDIKGGYRAIGIKYSTVLAGACRLEGGTYNSGGTMSCTGCFDQNMGPVNCP